MYTKKISEFLEQSAKKLQFFNDRYDFNKPYIAHINIQFVVLWLSNRPIIDNPHSLIIKRYDSLRQLIQWLNSVT